MSLTMVEAADFFRTRVLEEVVRPNSIDENTHFSLENESFPEPAVGPWIHFTYQLIRNEQDTLGETGNRQFMRRGLASVRISVDKESGQTPATELADDVLEAFEGVTFESIHCYEATPRTIGTTGKWFTVVVEIMFWYTQNK